MLVSVVKTVPFLYHYVYWDAANVFLTGGKQTLLLLTTNLAWCHLSVFSVLRWWDLVRRVGWLILLLWLSVCWPVSRTAQMKMSMPSGTTRCKDFTEACSSRFLVGCNVNDTRLPTSQRCHRYERHGLSDHWQLGCVFNCLFSLRKNMIQNYLQH